MEEMHLGGPQLHLLQSTLEVKDLLKKETDETVR